VLVTFFIRIRRTEEHF